MVSSMLRPTNWMLFRACVTLRRILAVRKPRPVRRAGKAAAMAGVWLTVICGAQANDQNPVPPPNLPAGHDGSDFGDGRIRPIQQIGTSMTPPSGELPTNRAQRQFAGAPMIMAAEIAGREWFDYVYFWQAPALCYRPLYFEEQNLERYGHTAGHLVQPVLSGAHFFAAVPALPVKLALERPWKSQYPLGHSRPGSPAPWRRPW